jgi:GT2 family glycosyltransferase
MFKALDSLKRIDRKTLYLFAKYLFSFDTTALRNLLSVYLVRLSKAPSYKPQIFFGNIDEREKLEFTREQKVLVSIIIPAFNQWDYTLSCLHSIRANTPEVAYEVIVADDSSTDETGKILDHVGNIRVIRNGCNLQFLKNCNRAARLASGKYLLFLNNDTNVQKNWLSRLLEPAEKDPAVGMVGAKLVYPDGRLQEAGGIIWSDGSGWNYGWFDDPQKPQYNYPREPDYVSGACLLIRRDLWEKTGGFDERFAPAYYEDTDLAFQVRSLGYKVIYQPESVVVHFEGISSGTDPDAGTKRHQEINRMIFLEKWRPVLEKEHVERGRRLPSLAKDRPAPKV